MIKSALQYIIGLSEVKVQDIILPDGTVQTYSDKQLHRLEKHIPKARAIEMSTLTSLVDYIKSKVDYTPNRMILHIESPTTVSFYSALNEEREREQLVVCKAKIPEFEFGIFVEHEKFIIGVQAKFVADAKSDKDLILKFAGTVEAGTVAQYGDDGVTQKATIKQGIASKTEAVVPNPVHLRPFRTFIEVEQPMSDFIFRIKQDKYDGINCALFTADGGAWKNEAMANIKQYLCEELKDYDITIIS